MILTTDADSLISPTWIDATLDHDVFGWNPSKDMNVIDSNMIEHDVVRKPVPTFRHHALGYHYALVRLAVGDDEVMYNEPGRMAALGSAKVPTLFVFASDPLPGARDDTEAQKRLLVEAYRGGRWRVPELMAKVAGASDFYMDAISRVTLERYARGRVALVGDAAYGNALGGFGTGLAVVGAYVLAGELCRAGGDHDAAFAQYEAKYRGYASVSRNINAGRLLAPATRLGIRARNLLFSALAAFGPLMELVDRPASNLKLDDYGDTI